MKNKLDKFIHSRLFIIVLVSVMVITTSLVGTYAWFTWRNPKDQNTLFTMSIGGIVDVTFGNGNAISGGLYPVYNYYDGLSTSFDINNKASDDTVVYYDIIFNITSIDSELISEDVKYVVLYQDKVVSEGNLSNASSGESMTLYSGYLQQGLSNAKIYFYLDGNVENDPNMMNKNISGNIVVNAVAMDNIALYINNLYLNNKNKVVTNNNIEYQYSESVNLMNDRLGGATEDYDAGNIRYYGANPNNYIDIGDRTSTGKMIPYRIIGLFKGVELVDGTKRDLVKIIRADSIGNYSWDNKTEGIGSSVSGWGSNDWSDSRLMMMLNPGYDKDIHGNIYSSSIPLLDVDGDVLYGYEGSLWWNSKSGTCYSGLGNKTTSCDFTSTGLSSDVHTKIEEVVWHLGGIHHHYDFVNEMYTNERGIYGYIDTNAGIERPVEWTGKVALMHTSDYGYAADLNSCKSNLFNYHTSGCYDSDWLYISNIEQWLLSPDSRYSYGGEFVTTLGAVNGNPLYYNDATVRPTFYLKSELNIVSGEGTIDRPYVIG